MGKYDFKINQLLW